jgi:hypothetical protein
MIKNWGAAWAVLALLGLAAVCARLSEFSIPHSDHYRAADHGAHAAKNEDDASDKIASSLAEIAQFVDAHNGTVSALAGVVVAIFTTILAWKTWGLHVATRGLQDLATVQAADMKESLRIADAAAKATLIAAEAAKKSADLLPNIERPFVFIDLVESSVISKLGEIQQLIERTISVRTKFRNYGRTPANIVKYVCLYELLDHIPNDDDINTYIGDASKVEEIIIVIVVGADREWITPWTGKIISANSDAGEQFSSGNLELYYWGALEYKDIFDETHLTHFCRRLNVKTWQFEPIGPFERNSAR